MIATTATGARDFLRIADRDPDELLKLLRLADEMKKLPRRHLLALAGESIACYFAKPSTRTRVSFEGAAQRLGILPIMLRPDELQLGRGEPISDTARVLSAYTAAIVVRTFAQHEVEEIAASASVPVINALTDQHHPCQVLADLMTLRERFGELRGLKLAYLGDGNNVAHSLMEAGALLGIEVAVATPIEYRPDHDIAVAAMDMALTNGGSVYVVDEPLDALTDADVVYTDVWVSMGNDAERERRLEALSRFRVTQRFMDMASPDAVFMHCLPAHRGEEVDADVIDGPQSIVFEQAANRMPTEQALLFSLIKGER